MKRIEEFVSPDGFVVETREVIREKGVPVAEFDVHITGRVGSSAVDWLIECRDRPSDGPQGVPWIEQLIGRQSVHRFDKVFAVSTTGFTAPARDLAGRYGIVLRTITAVEDLAGDFNVASYTMHLCQVRPSGPFDVKTADRIPRMLDTPLDDIGFRRHGEGSFRDLHTFALEQLGLPLPDYPEGENTEELRFSIDNVDMRVGGDVFAVGHLDVPLVITTRVLPARVLTANIYAESGRQIGTEGEFEWDIGGQIAKAWVVTSPQADGTNKMRVALPSGLPNVRFERVQLWGRT